MNIIFQRLFPTFVTGMNLARRVGDGPDEFVHPWVLSVGDAIEAITQRSRTACSAVGNGRYRRAGRLQYDE